MAKKKMTPAQAAAARRPDDWEPRQSAKPAKRDELKLHSATSVMRDSAKNENKRMWAGFIALFIVAAIAAPFLVIYLSRLFGIA